MGFLSTVPVAGASRAYWREILLVLVAKAVGLTLLYAAFFATPPHAPPIGERLFHQGARP